MSPPVSWWSGPLVTHFTNEPKEPPVTRGTRTRIALVQSAPTALTLPPLALLAAFGSVPWSVLVAVPLALVVQSAATYVRLRPRA